jgi:hypothetical protein
MDMTPSLIDQVFPMTVLSGGVAAMLLVPQALPLFVLAAMSATTFLTGMN